jgi:hypothetical protein
MTPDCDPLAQLGVSLGRNTCKCNSPGNESPRSDYRDSTAACFENGEPKLAARSEATSEYLELMQPVVVLADKQQYVSALHRSFVGLSLMHSSFSLNETEFAAAERIIAENLEMIKRMSQQNVGRPLRLGMVTLQLDARQTNLASSMLMALMEAMHTVEGDIMDR